MRTEEAENEISGKLMSLDIVCGRRSAFIPILSIEYCHWSNFSYLPSPFLTYYCMFVNPWTVPASDDRGTKISEMAGYVIRESGRWKSCSWPVMWVGGQSPPNGFRSRRDFSDHKDSLRSDLDNKNIIVHVHMLYILYYIIISQDVITTFF